MRATGYFFILLLPFLACKDSAQKPDINKPPVEAAVKHNLDQATDEESVQKQKQFKEYFSSLVKTRRFNGTVLIAKKGKIIYKDAFGYSNFKTKDTLKVSTAFQLASVSKQFTAVAIMMLQESGKLKYEDLVQKYIPELPYEGITIYQLLTHRSGVPNYTYFAEEYCTDKDSPISNDDMVCYMEVFKPGAYHKPDRCFDYSNTGYAILASIVERVSGVSFEDFAREHIFEPLGMMNTFVYNKTKDYKFTDEAVGHTAGRRIIEYNYLNGVVGDKGVYSTVEDLYVWDRALYSDKLLKASTLEQAYQPSNKRTRKAINYGFGWRLCNMNRGGRVAFHSGWWQGFKTCFVRLLDDQSCIIVLTNVANRGFSFNDVPDVLNILYPGEEFNFVK